MVVGRSRIEEPLAVEIDVHAHLGSNESPVLDALAADVAPVRTDEGVPGAEVPLMMDADDAAPTPAVALTGADRVEKRAIDEGNPVGRQRMFQPEFRTDETARLKSRFGKFESEIKGVIA